MQDSKSSNKICNVKTKQKTEIDACIGKTQAEISKKQTSKNVSKNLENIEANVLNSASAETKSSSHVCMHLVSRV